MTRRGRWGSIDCAALLSRTHTPSTLQAFTRAADGTTPSTTTAAWRGGGAPALAAAAQQQRRWATNSHDVFNTVRKESGEEREGDSTRARALAARRASPVVRKGRERERERGFWHAWAQHAAQQVSGRATAAAHPIGPRSQPPLSPLSAPSNHSTKTRPPTTRPPPSTSAPPTTTASPPSSPTTPPTGPPPP